MPPTRNGTSTGRNGDTSSVPQRQDRRGFGEFFALSGVFIALSILGFYFEYAFSKIESSMGPRIMSTVFGLVGVILFIAAEKSSRPPHNGPHEFVKKEIQKGKRGEDSKVLLCLGDSLTQGTCSAAWVDNIVPAVLAKTSNGTSVPLTVVNAGQNSIVSHTVFHEKVNDVIKCRPDYVFVLIGSNDVMAIYRKDWANDRIRLWNLPIRPTADILISNLKNTVKKLLKETSAKIAVGTLPPMSEDPGSESNKIVEMINRRIRCIPRNLDDESAERVTVLDINGALWATVNDSQREEKQQKIHSVDDFLLPAIIMGVLHHVFHLSWNFLSRRITGNVVLSESLHFNEKGGDIVKGEVVSWLMKSGNDFVVGG